MFTEFVNELPERVNDLVTAAENQDAQTLCRLSHNLKGLASNFGADTLVALSRELEGETRQGKLTGAPFLVGRLLAEIPRYKDCLVEIQRRLKPL
jgi:HPt (histidine-containing phosphotransfer) domain-containing protein